MTGTGRQAPDRQDTEEDVRDRERRFLLDHRLHPRRPDTQRELVRAFAEIPPRWVRFHPGYRLARFFVSTDGTRVYNLVHWDSEADYRHFVDTSDTEGRMAAIQAAIAGLSGRAEPRMSGVPTYTVVHEVGPGPRRADA